MKTIAVQVESGYTTASIDGDNVAVSVAAPAVQVAVSSQPVLAAASNVNIGPVAVSVTPSASSPQPMTTVGITGGSVSPLVLEILQQVAA